MAERSEWSKLTPRRASTPSRSRHRRLCTPGRRGACSRPHLRLHCARLGRKAPWMTQHEWGEDGRRSRSRWSQYQDQTKGHRDVVHVEEDRPRKPQQTRAPPPPPHPQHLPPQRQPQGPPDRQGDRDDDGGVDGACGGYSYSHSRRTIRRRCSTTRSQEARARGPARGPMQSRLVLPRTRGGGSMRHAASQLHEQGAAAGANYTSPPQGFGGPPRQASSKRAGRRKWPGGRGGLAYRARHRESWPAARRPAGRAP
jgi:hypothetical protein